MIKKITYIEFSSVQRKVHILTEGASPPQKDQLKMLNWAS